jgi:hypothetical protein
VGSEVDRVQRNKVGYLGLLGFVGLLGLVTGNLGFYGFFGFFGLLSALWGRGLDERVDRNIDRACRDSFIFTMVSSTFLLAYIAALRALDLFPTAFSVLFSGNIILFGASFIYRDNRGG